MTEITAGVNALMGFAGDMLDTILENGVLTLFLAVPIVGAAIGVVRKLIHTR